MPLTAPSVCCPRCHVVVILLNLLIYSPQMSYQSGKLQQAGMSGQTQRAFVHSKLAVLKGVINNGQPKRPMEKTHRMKTDYWTIWPFRMTVYIKRKQCKAK